MNFRPAHDGTCDSVAPMGTMSEAMQNSEMSVSLFNRFPNVRDDRLFAIGPIIIYVSPKLVDKHINGLPIFETQY